MLIIKKSRLKNAGNGLFTTSKIKKGDLIVEYKGKKVTWAQCEKRYGKLVNKAKYIFYISKNNCIDAQDTPEELARYANDALGFSTKKNIDNNSEYNVVKGKGYIVATRNINAGEEIFVDYQREYWEAQAED